MKTLIFGAGQVAEVFAAYIGHENIAAFVVDRNYIHPSRDASMTIVPFENLWEQFDPRTHVFMVGMSFKGLNQPRQKKFDAMRAQGYLPLVCISPKASWLDPIKVGFGTFIMDENTIQPYASIGENCVLWSGSHFGHHCKIGNHVFVASHVVVSGGVEIGDRTFIGVNATIADGVKIGADCIIGAGTLITEDCAPGGVYQGSRSERSKVPSSRMRGVWAR